MTTASRSGRPTTHQRTANPASAASSTASSDAVRRRMQAQRTRDTSPELAIRRVLHARGLRYRVDHAPVTGLRRRADVVFARARLAVFIDGCFWHGCPDHGRTPRTNSYYWAAKIAANRARDEDTTMRMTQQGWRVLRIWEHEPVHEAVRRICDRLGAPTRDARVITEL